MRPYKTAQDPLQEILQRHLFKASTENVNSSSVINSVVADYVQLLYSQGVHIPQSVQKYFIEDLKEEIKDMVIKATHASVPCETEFNQSSSIVMEGVRLAIRKSS